MKLTNYGMPTLIETSTLEECAKLCAELGLNFIELNMNMPQYQLDKIDVDYFKSIADRYGIYYTIHLDEKELALAEWHHRGALPAKDDGLTLTREMIRVFDEGNHPK